MYENTGSGLQKISDERMLNGRGRKVVHERLGNDTNSYDHFKKMHRD